MIKKNTDLYSAIENTIYDMFDNNGIDLNDPKETTEQFIKRVSKYLEDFEE